MSTPSNTSATPSAAAATPSAAPRAPRNGKPAKPAPSPDAATQALTDALALVTAHYKLSSPAAATRALAAAANLARARSYRGQTDARLPVIGTGVTGVSTKDGKKTSKSTETRDVSSLTPEALKSYKEATRLVQAGDALHM